MPSGPEPALRPLSDLLSELCARRQVLGRHVVQIDRMRSRNHQGVTRRHRIHVHEGDGPLGLSDRGRRDRARNDAAEDAVRFGGHRRDRTDAPEGATARLPSAPARASRAAREPTLGAIARPAVDRRVLHTSGCDSRVDSYTEDHRDGERWVAFRFSRLSCTSSDRPMIAANRARRPASPAIGRPSADGISPRGHAAVQLY
jgi:hypothetical protein